MATGAEEISRQGCGKAIARMDARGFLLRRERAQNRSSVGIMSQAQEGAAVSAGRAEPTGL